MIKYYLHLAIQRKTLMRSIRVALLVGIVLNLINHPELIFLTASNINIGTVTLTFLVPFLVSTYSSVIISKTLKPGTISNLDAILKCTSCNKTNFHIHIGQEVEECPECKKKTSWKPLKISTITNNENELIKSLALFARYNPMPLLRTTTKRIILGANPAADQLFSEKELIGHDLTEFIPEVIKIDFEELIRSQGLKEIIIEKSGKYYNLLFKGVNVLNTVHIYGNDITEIVLAEKKIRAQANDISQSIQYAWRIQNAMLPSNETLTNMYPNHFVFNRPRNTVSGDFYWANQIDKYKIIAVADCTGHGVPGAFMSMMGISLLNEIILREKIMQPSAILNILRERLISALMNKGQEIRISDGMDISLISLNTETNFVHFAGAYNPLYIVRNNEIIVLEADRMPIGHFVKDNIPFTEKEMQLNNGDNLFLFTDGFKDQIGGDRNKKYSSIQFKELLLEISKYPSKIQEQLISSEFDNWIQNQKQVDDILILGIKI